MPAVVNRTSCRIRVPRRALIKTLAEIKRVAPSRSAKPILQSVRLEGRKNRLHLAATNLEMTLSLTLEAGGRLPACLVPVGELLARVQAGKDKTCSLELSEDHQQILLNGGRVRHAIPAMELVEYPPLPKKPRRRPPDLQIMPDALRVALENALIATSRETGRYALNAVLLERDGDSTRLVATDGKRLIVQTLSEASGPWTGKALIPWTLAQQAVRLLKSGKPGGDPVAVTIAPPSRGSADTMLFLEGPDWRLCGFAMDGSFPVYTDVIPGPGVRFIVPRLAFAETLREVAQAITFESRAVRLEATREAVRLTVQSGHGSQAAGEIPVEQVLPPELARGPLHYVGGVIPGQISDALGTLEGDSIAFEVVPGDAAPPETPAEADAEQPGDPTAPKPTSPRLRPIQLTDAVENPRTRWVIMPIVVE